MLPFGTPAEVREQVRQRIKILARAAGLFSIPFTTCRQACRLRISWQCMKPCENRAISVGVVGPRTPGGGRHGSAPHSRIGLVGERSALPREPESLLYPTLPLACSAQNSPRLQNPTYAPASKVTFLVRHFVGRADGWCIGCCGGLDENMACDFDGKRCIGGRRLKSYHAGR